MAADGAGSQLGQYVLLRRIARGGMAEVFLAQQRGLEGFDRRVAVKRILPHLSDAPDFIKMFLSEAKLAAQLSHPNIVHIYDFGKVDDDYFIAMEYVDGVHAGRLVKASERLPPAMVARLGADAAAALHHAHALRANGQPIGLVHRDVSPPNLMISFDGVVKLCDFGIAKAAALSQQLTNPGQVKGKYAYMSPEQTTGSPLDGRSDVFSLGIVLWELLAGRTIVGRGDAIEAMRAIRDGRLEPIEQAAPQTPGALAAAVAWALQTRRELRPSAMQLAERLETFLKSSPELATPMQVGAWLRARFTSEPGEAEEAAAGEGQIGPAALAARAAQLGFERVSGELPSGVLWSAHPSILTADTTSQVAASGIAPSAPAMAPGPTHKPAHAPGPAHAPPAAPAPAVIPVPVPVQAPTMIAAERAPTAPAEAPTLLDPRMLVPSPPRARPPIALPAHIADGSLTANAQRQRRLRIGLAVAGLLVIAVASLAIVLAARSKGGVKTEPAIADAGPGESSNGSARDASEDLADGAMAGSADSAAPSETMAGSATAGSAASKPRDGETTILEVRTRPEGATVKVAGKQQVAPARFVLPAGRYAIDAEAKGWMPERRSVELVEGVRLVQDILFTTRLHGKRKPGPKKRPAGK
ncbi:MAG TPA: serine/threonine-protein kinase [Kofleriaceae bacterium]|nr:serine/threonine-protein kinase [Kofleriaceae bacterium]